MFFFRSLLFVFRVLRMGCVVFGVSFELFTAVWLTTPFFWDVRPRLCLVVWDVPKAICVMPLISDPEVFTQ